MRKEHNVLISKFSFLRPMRALRVLGG